MQPTASRAAVGTFRALYEDHYGFVYATVQRMGVRPDAIDDVVHDAFLVVFRRWEDLPADRERAWLYGIARRVSSNVRKGERRRARKHEALRSVHAQVEDVRGWLEASTVLHRFIASLRPRDRELFVLGAIEGLTGRELAAALSAPASTLYGRLQVLRKQFQEVAGADALALERARTKQPRASAAGWAVLVPKLGLSTAGAGALAWAGGAAAIVAAGALAWMPADSTGSPSRLEPQVVSIPRSPRPPVSPVATVPANVPARVSTPPSEASPSRPRRPKRPDPLAAEATLVQSLRESVRRGESRQALRLVATHRQRHAHGALADVVVALEVEALCDLGRTDDARTRADELLRRRPNTPVARRLSSGCRAKKNEGAFENPLEGGHGGE